MAVREIRLAVVREPSVTVAREQANLLAGQQRRCVDDVPERQRPRATLETEPERHFDPRLP